MAAPRGIEPPTRCVIDLVLRPPDMEDRRASGHPVTGAQCDQPCSGASWERLTAPMGNYVGPRDRAAATIAHTSRPRSRIKSTTGASSTARTRASTISTFVVVLRPANAPFTAPQMGFL